jgi:phage terminase Nu1 subunit (DNA packaging protein)
MTPLPRGVLANLLQTLPPEHPNRFPHLENLNADQLLQRRVEISGQLKSL